MQQATNDPFAQPSGPVSPDPLANLEQTIQEHWQEARPGMVARLKERGLLEACIKDAAATTRDAMRDLIDDGMSPLAAWEEVRTWAAILPTEEDDPNLDGGADEGDDFLDSDEDDGLDSEPPGFTFAELEALANEGLDDEEESEEG